jgi:hypothetical protein
MSDNKIDLLDATVLLFQERLDRRNLILVDPKAFENSEFAYEIIKRGLLRYLTEEQASHFNVEEFVDAVREDYYSLYEWAPEGLLCRYEASIGFMKKIGIPSATKDFYKKLNKEAVRVYYLRTIGDIRQVGDLVALSAHAVSADQDGVARDCVVTVNL